MDRNNKGNVVVEASIVVPLFLFFSLAMFHMLQSKLAEQLVYEAVAETAEYVSEAAYLSDYDIWLAGAKFPGYIDDELLVERYIVGGKNGVSFLGSSSSDDGEKLSFVFSYGVEIPNLLGLSLTGERRYYFEKRAYVGDHWEAVAEVEEGDAFVYITDNKEVYHNSRCCSHLELSIMQTNVKIAKDEGFTPCEFCGEKTKEVAYITAEGERYHSSDSCSGLKRTVYRVRKSTVGDLPGCERCVGD